MGEDGAPCRAILLILCVTTYGDVLICSRNRAAVSQPIAAGAIPDLVDPLVASQRVSTVGG